MLFGLQSPARLDPAQVAAAKDRLQYRMEQDPSVPSMQPGGLTTLSLNPSANPPGLSAPTNPPAAAFQWGEGGARLTPEEIASRRSVTQQQIAAGMDFSPVKSWTQGAARVAQALIGSMEQKKLDKASAANASASQQILAALTGGGSVAGGKGNDAATLAAISSPYISDDTKAALKLQWQATHKEPPPPHYFQTNNGSEAVIGADGRPQIIYQDPDPKMNFIPDGMGGGNWVPVPTQSAGAPSSAPPLRPVGKLTPITGGAPSQGGATFP
jgi:hypothetical protein